MGGVPGRASPVPVSREAGRPAGPAWMRTTARRRHAGDLRRVPAAHHRRRRTCYCSARSLRIRPRARGPARPSDRSWLARRSPRGAAGRPPHPRRGCHATRAAGFRHGGGAAQPSLARTVASRCWSSASARSVRCWARLGEPAPGSSPRVKWCGSQGCLPCLPAAIAIELYSRYSQVNLDSRRDKMIACRKSAEVSRLCARTLSQTPSGIVA